jgi:hypothetical protein
MNENRDSADAGQRVWGGNWQAKLRSKLHSLGCENIHDFLVRYPAESYLKLAKRLGEDIAALQLIWMQFDEAVRDKQFREAAKDCLTREVTAHLKRGWGKGVRIDFHTAGVYADWIGELTRVEPQARPLADAVWKALKELQPPEGWLPASPDDPLIVSAFDEGWPDSLYVEAERQPPQLFCPNCTAVLLPPSEEDNEQTCHHCQHRILLG